MKKIKQKFIGFKTLAAAVVGLGIFASQTQAKDMIGGVLPPMPGGDVGIDGSSSSAIQFGASYLFQSSDDIDANGVDLEGGWYYDSGSVYAHFLGLNVVVLEKFEDSANFAGIRADAEAQYVGVFATFRPYVYVAKKLKVYGEAGIGIGLVELDGSVRSRFGNASGSSDEAVLTGRLGAGLEFDVNDNIAVKAGYLGTWFDEVTAEAGSANFTAGDEFANGFNVGLVFRF